MITNIDINEDLLREAQELAGGKTKKAVVNEALADFVRTRKQRSVLSLFGSVDFDADYDYKKERSRR